MAGGPKPLGERTMTFAERQARYRAAHATIRAATVSICHRKPADRRSWPQWWRDAVSELLELQADYQQWLNVSPESLADTHTANALCDVVASICPARRLIP